MITRLRLTSGRGVIARSPSPCLLATAGAGGGVKGDYYNGTDLWDLVLTRMDPQINFSYGEGSPDPLVNVDLFSVRWTGEVEAAFTETYTFYTMSDDGVRLWIDGQQIIDDWNDHAAQVDDPFDQRGRHGQRCHRLPSLCRQCRDAPTACLP